jgi:hypothetical protein
MILRSRSTLQGLLGIAVLATLLAGCGSAKATAPSPSAVPSATTWTALPSVGPSTSPGYSVDVIVPGSPAPSATPEPTFPAQHVDAALEDTLPSTISGVPLVKTSLMLSGYIASAPAGAGDKALYPTWLAKFGKTPGDIKIAISVSLSDSVNFQARAIQVPGVSAAALSAGFADVARKADWPVTNHPNLMSTGKTVLEIINPVVKAAGGVGAGYVYARDGVLYEVITDDQAILLDALIQLP